MPKHRFPREKVLSEELSNQVHLNKRLNDTIEGELDGNIGIIKSLFEDGDGIGPTTSMNDKNASLNSNTAALHGELDLFRQRWKRELEKTGSINRVNSDVDLKKQTSELKTNFGKSQNDEISSENKFKSHHATLRESFAALNNPPKDQKDVYNLAKKLFSIGVDLERDELHNESIRYYRQAIHLCPNIEKQIFLEQQETSALAERHVHESNNQKENYDPSIQSGDKLEAEKIPLLDRISANHIENLKESKFTLCKPANKLKVSTLHISNLPHDLILKICRYVIGQELDLASLEHLGMVCRGFYLLSNDPSLWRGICYRTWGAESFNATTDGKAPYQINWKQLYIVKPRINCDGVYMSRTRYIRQGETGFQDITYRPFHLIRYYRYMRFFPDKRVLILTTNEEPEKIIPIFRHAVNSKHFSPELSVLEGTYEFIEPNQVVIVAEKEFQTEDQSQQSSRHLDSRRQVRFHWSRQTPLNQRFNMKFELKTNENCPYRNNSLKWCEYTISSKFETGSEVTNFDLFQDSFPNLAFSRVKRLNLRSIES